MKLHLFFIGILLLSYACNKLEVRKESLQSDRLADLKQQSQNLAYYDSLLQIRLSQRDSMKSYFLFEKNPEYDEIGKYYAKSQKLENNLRRSYIRSVVNELGIMELASIYYGAQPIRHTGLKVSGSEGEYTETEVIPYDGGMNYSFTNLNMTTETVTYAGGKDNGVIQFIYNNMSIPLKAEYTGGNKKYSFTISQADKAALVDIRDFSVVLSDIDRLNKEMEKSKLRNYELGIEN
ncbi:MAG: hypothetical protein LBR97_08935 [Dysgonamonadaceae bacterium]|jgi:hypothetical protein|nr:hypothetical protein [Dysgonamonadaceae bacterium]